MTRSENIQHYSRLNVQSSDSPIAPVIANQQLSAPDTSVMINLISLNDLKDYMEIRQEASAY